MNEALLAYYNDELRHLRAMGGEFAAAFPKVASRLGLDAFECADPYVERLLEGFSFLTARVRMQMDAQFPRFTEHLAEMIHPGLLAPTPSMAVVQFEPDRTHPALARGVMIPRGTALLSQLGHDNATRCQYRTAHAVPLLPLRLTQADYGAFDCLPPGIDLQPIREPQATLRLRFEWGAGTPAAVRSLDRLSLYLRGTEGLAERLHAQMTGHCCAAFGRVGQGRDARYVPLGAQCVDAKGFEDSEALLPAVGSTYRGCRLLREYFAFPERYLFVEVSGLSACVARSGSTLFDVVLLLDEFDATLLTSVTASNFALHCTPAINLFARRADRIGMDDRRFEHQVVVDRTRPLDFEVFSIEGVDGYVSGRAEPKRFAPFYRAGDPGQRLGERAYFQMRRASRLRSARELAGGARSRYAGTDVFVALVDPAQAPYPGDIRQLGIDVLCTNRDLPLSMPLDSGPTDFTGGADLPAVERVGCLSGPSAPRPPLAEQANLWRLLDVLCTNRLPLVERAAQGSIGHDAQALRRWLAALCPDGDAAGLRQIEALRQASARTIIRRLALPGLVCFGRGLEMTLTFDGSAVSRCRAPLLGAVLAAALADYMPINQFSETVVRTPAHGTVMRYRTQLGRREVL